MLKRGRETAWCAAISQEAVSCNLFRLPRLILCQCLIDQPLKQPLGTRIGEECVPTSGRLHLLEKQLGERTLFVFGELLGQRECFFEPISHHCPPTFIGMKR